MSKLWMVGLTLITVSFSSPVVAMDKVIYGVDDRRDIYEEFDPMFLELSRSTAAMIPTDKIRKGTTETVIVGKTLEQRGICSHAAFANQGTAANCSGFLIADDILVTAGHCMKSQSSCDNYKWVFDYAYESSDITANITVDNDNVYGCKEIIAQELNSQNKNDFAIVRLDRKVSNRASLKVRTSGKVSKTDELVVIGHPTGLPTKIADNAFVRANTNDIYFVTNLDTFGGNSGSAVFNAQTGEVEGILVRGEQDYVYDWSKGCRVPKECSEDGCRGEDVTRITNIPELMKIVK